MIKVIIRRVFIICVCFCIFTTSLGIPFDITYSSCNESESLKTKTTSGLYELNYNKEKGVAENVDEITPTYVDEYIEVTPTFYEFYPVIKKYSYDLFETIDIVFMLECDSELESLNSTTEGFREVHLPNYTTGMITVSIQNIGDCINLKYSIFANLKNGVTLEANIFGLIAENKVYISEYSYLGAKDVYYAEDNDRELSLDNNPHYFLGEEVKCIKENSFVIDSTSIISNDSKSVDSFIMGTLKWEDDWGNSHPLQFTKVTVYDQGGYLGLLDISLGTVYTNETGLFFLGFNNRTDGCNLYIKIYASGENSTVKTAANNEYVWQSNVTSNVTTGSITVINVDMDMTEDIGKAFQVSQAVITASRYANNMTETNIADVVVKYPNASSSGCYYQNNTIFIIGNRTNDSQIIDGEVLHSYASWDVIMHEYNHHVQSKLNITGNPGHWHSFTTNMYNHYMSHHGGASAGNCFNSAGEITCANPAASQAKEKAIKIAYAESWASAIAGMGQLYAIDNWALDDNIHTVGDATYNSYNGASLNYNNTATNAISDVVEASIAGILWDFYDNDTGESHDAIALTDAQIWEISTHNNAKTLSDFMSSFYQRLDFSYNHSSGAVLSYYKVASTKPIMSNEANVSQSIPPIFSWTPQSGTNSLPNNSFVLIVYDYAGSEIFRTSPMTTNSYSLTADQWESVLYSYGKSYYVAIASKQTNSPITGEYISEFALFPKPTPPSLSQNISIPVNNRYTEEIITLQPSQYIEYRVTFSNNGTKLIQTFGPDDSRLYLYDVNHNLLSSDNNSGYSHNALLSLDAIANTTYIIRMKFVSSHVSGKIKLSIVPAWPYVSYEDIYSLSDYTLGLTWSFAQYKVSLLTYIYSSTQDLTMHVSSTVDTFLYIIDPRSTEPISPASINYPDSTMSLACLYNDNISLSDTNSKIKKTFEKDVPYLVIVCAKDPSLSSSVGSYYLNFVS